MIEKEELIRQAIDFQQDINQLIMEYRPEDWLSLDLTIAQLKSIVYIYSRGRANFRELAQALHVTPSVVTGIVDRLVLQGMVKRRRVGSSVDRRVQWLVVTNKGRALLDNIRQRTVANISQILAMMSDEDLTALARGFSALFQATESFIKNRGKAGDLTLDNADSLSAGGRFLE